MLKKNTKGESRKWEMAYRAPRSFIARASRLEGKVRNVGIKPICKKKQK
ncbi:hypothetical protein KKB69_01360 [Patescibacteria group bacterium]|nr:hypothetical protein [Patescibacteria group bacterium]